MNSALIRSIALVTTTMVSALGSVPAHAVPLFTGPASPYYLDNFGNGHVYVVQGTSVINSFPDAYGQTPGTSNCSKGGSYCESNLAVTNVVSTTGFGPGAGSTGTAGQYTLGGTPTGTSWPDTVLAGANDQFYDGTSDRTHNYTLEWTQTHLNPGAPERVIVTDLNWQNASVLFTVPNTVTGDYLGITYDPYNNSLWLSGWNKATIADYSMTGQLLSSFSGIGDSETALGFDPADGTLWLSFDATNQLYQYSTAGTLLQFGTPTGLPTGNLFAGEFAEAAPAATGVPEPASLALFGTALAGLRFLRRRTQIAA